MKNASNLYSNGTAFASNTEVFSTATLGTASAWSLLFDGVNLPDGTYTVRVRSTDAAGDVETNVVSTRFLIDLTPPAITPKSEV